MTQAAKGLPRKGTGPPRNNPCGPGKDADQSAGTANPGKEAFTVNVEAIAWVRTFLGGPASGSQEFEEPARKGDTVRDVLKALSARFPQLDNALWDENARNEIGTHIEIIVNDTIMGSDYSLESQVKAGDQIILTGQYIGG